MRSGEVDAIMIRLNRTSEYALLALGLIAGRGAMRPVSAREVSEEFRIPFEVTAKTLQRIRDSGWIFSVQGPRGGYRLARSLHEISLLEFLTVVEGPQQVVSCADPAQRQPEGSPYCQVACSCSVRPALETLNVRVSGFLSGIMLSDLVRPEVAVLNKPGRSVRGGSWAMGGEP